jgi:hypothetical protein
VYIVSPGLKLKMCVYIVGIIKNVCCECLTLFEAVEQISVENSFSISCEHLVALKGEQAVEQRI